MKKVKCEIKSIQVFERLQIGYCGGKWVNHLNSRMPEYIYLEVRYDRNKIRFDEPFAAFDRVEMPLLSFYKKCDYEFRGAAHKAFMRLCRKAFRGNKILYKFFNEHPRYFGRYPKHPEILFDGKPLEYEWMGVDLIF